MLGIAKQKREKKNYTDLVNGTNVSPSNRNQYIDPNIVLYHGHNPSKFDLSNIYNN